MTTAYLGLGSNLGDRLSQLRFAISQLAKLGDSWAVSPIYATEPVGGPSGQGPYLNCVMRLDTGFGAHELLRAGLALEDRAGRMRAERNGPRPLDVDLLLYGDERIEDDELVVPHPRMYERSFVLAPLADLAPELLPAGWTGTGVRRIGTLEE